MPRRQTSFIFSLSKFTIDRFQVVGGNRVFCCLPMPTSNWLCMCCHGRRPYLKGVHKTKPCRLNMLFFDWFSKWKKVFLVILEFIVSVSPPYLHDHNLRFLQGQADVPADCGPRFVRAQRQTHLHQTLHVSASPWLHMLQSEGKNRDIVLDSQCNDELDDNIVSKLYTIVFDHMWLTKKTPLVFVLKLGKAPRKKQTGSTCGRN